MCFDKLCPRGGLGVSQVANIAIILMIGVDHGKRGTREFSLVFKLHRAESFLLVPNALPDFVLSFLKSMVFGRYPTLSDTSNIVHGSIAVFSGVVIFIWRFEFIHREIRF